MAEAIESMSQSELRKEVATARNQKAKARAEGKAASMQLAEKGAAVLGAVGSGAIVAYKPDLGTALGGVGYVNPVLVVLGLGLSFGTKGMAREAGSGFLMAGGVPMLNLLGAKLTALATGG
jgi:hypothetical protein